MTGVSDVCSSDLSHGLASEDGEVTMKCINKAMKSEDSAVVKMANFAKNIKGYKGSKH